MKVAVFLLMIFIIFLLGYVLSLISTSFNLVKLVLSFIGVNVEGLVGDPYDVVSTILVTVSMILFVLAIIHIGKSIREAD